jgi:hypothetical protein
LSKQICHDVDAARNGVEPEVPLYEVYVVSMKELGCSMVGVEERRKTRYHFPHHLMIRLYALLDSTPQ